MPAIFADEIFSELGRRLLGIYSTFDLQVSQFDDLLLKFDGYWLYIRRAAHGFLSILTSETVNYPALKMAEQSGPVPVDQPDPDGQTDRPLRRLRQPRQRSPHPAPAPVPVALPPPAPAKWSRLR